MKKILLTLCTGLCLVSGAWAGNNAHTRLRTLASSFKKEPGFEIVDIGGVAMGLIKTAAKAAADSEEDRQALAVLGGLKRLTVVDFSEAAEPHRKQFLRKAQQILSGSEILMEARDGDEAVRIYGTTSADGKRIQDLVIFTEDALISIRGTIDADRIGDLVKQAGS